MAYALAEEEVSRLLIYDIDREKAEKVAAGVTHHYPEVEISVDQPAPQGFDIVANATPVGMSPSDPYPLDPELLDPVQLVTEMIMKPNITPFLLAAQEKGCSIQGGYEALKGQAKATMDFFDLK